MNEGSNEVYEPNKIEIATTLQKSRNYALCCCFTTGIIVTAFALLLGMTVGNLTSTAYLGVAVIWIIIVLATIPILLLYKRPSKIRTFSISDKSIRIMVPNKEKFQIEWDQIEAVEVNRIRTGRRKGYSRGLLAVVTLPDTLTPMHVYNDINFTTTDGSQRTYRIDMTRDFPKKTCKEIRALLEQYANKMNKGYEYTKKFWT